MQLRIKMTNQNTGEFVYVFRNVTMAHDAANIVRRLNAVNIECAKATGKAIKFFYSIVVR